jgi:hypothetical protein
MIIRHTTNTEAYANGANAYYEGHTSHYNPYNRMSQNYSYTQGEEGYIVTMMHDREES